MKNRKFHLFFLYCKFKEAILIYKNEFTKKIYSIMILKETKELLQKERSLLLSAGIEISQHKLNDLEYRIANLSFSIAELEEVFMKKTWFYDPTPIEITDGARNICVGKIAEINDKTNYK